MRWLALALLCGCIDGGVHSYACDVSASGQHTCQDFVYTSASRSDAGKAACTGTVETACTHVSTSGGCKVTDPDGVTEVTTWSYDGESVADVMTSCESDHGVYQAP